MENWKKKGEFEDQWLRGEDWSLLLESPLLGDWCWIRFGTVTWNELATRVTKSHSNTGISIHSVPTKHSHPAKQTSYRPWVSDCIPHFFVMILKIHIVLSSSTCHNLCNRSVHYPSRIQFSPLYNSTQTGLSQMMMRSHCQPTVVHQSHSQSIGQHPTNLLATLYNNLYRHAILHSHSTMSLTSNRTKDRRVLQIATSPQSTCHRSLPSRGAESASMRRDRERSETHANANPDATTDGRLHLSTQINRRID